MKKSMSTQIIRNNKLNIKDMDKIMSESTNVTLNSPNFPNFNEIMGKYSSFTTPHKDLKKSSRENSEERETNRLPLVKQRPQDKIYIEGDDSLDYNSKLHDSRDTRGDTESPFRRSAMIFSPASTRYTNSASPNKKNRGPNVADKVSGFFKTVDNFYKDTNKQSGHLKHIIKEASEQLENDCNKYTSLEEGPLGTLSPEFALYKQRRIFRRKLAENITKKIQNLHVFVNALHNKRQRDKFNHVILPKASALG